MPHTFDLGLAGDRGRGLQLVLGPLMRPAGHENRWPAHVVLKRKASGKG
jgi:hypothetical protein